MDKPTLAALGMCSPPSPNLRAEREQKAKKEKKQMDGVEFATFILVFLLFIMQLRTEFLSRRGRK